MNKVFCSPITRFILFLIGYIAALQVARAYSGNFNMMFERLLGNALNLEWMISVLLFTVCIGLLIVSILKTNSTTEQRRVKPFTGNVDLFFLVVFATCIIFVLILLSLARSISAAQFTFIVDIPSFTLPIFLLLTVPAFIIIEQGRLRGFGKNTDFFLLVVFAVFIVLFLLNIADITNMMHINIFFLLPIIAYTIVVATAAEFLTRFRDKDLLHSLYWARFFRLYPMWKPLGALLVLLLAGNLTVLFTLIPEFAEWFTAQIIFTVVPQPFTFPNFLFLLSIFTLIALTYFVAFVLSLAEKYDLANVEKIRAERFKSELITNVSHDIRTPLTSIINYVDLLNKLPLQGKAADYISLLDQKSGRLKILIDDLIEASKAGTGNVQMSMQTVNLNEIVGQAAGEFEEQFEERNLTLVFNQPEEPTYINADNRHLWRVLENLFSNVAKYAFAGTRVFVEITLLDKDRWAFTLKNTSQAPIDLNGDALTEQFIRGDRARQTEGSGLGLYIAKNLVELMDGQFTIRITGDLFEVEIIFKSSND